MPSLNNESEAAAYLQLSRSFLRQARVRGSGPSFIKLGRSVRYRIEDLNNWVEENARKNTIRQSNTELRAPIMVPKPNLQTTKRNKR